MIKFACAHCGKRLGVSLQAAGKWVKCPKCAQPTRVPQAPSLDQDGLVPLKEPEAVPPAAPPRAPMPAERTCPNCGSSNVPDTDFCISCGHRLMAGSPAGARARPRQPGSRVMLGLLVGLGFSVGAALLWTVLVYYVSLRWVGFLAATVCALAGVGFRLASPKRGAGIGLAVACIGLCGILFGKVLIASWVVMPELARIRGFESLEITELSEKEIKEVMQDEHQMFCVACDHIARKEQWDDDFTFKVKWAHGWGMEDMKVSKEEEQEIKAVTAQVKAVLAGWTDLQKSAAIQADWAISQAAMKEFAIGMARLAREAMKKSDDPMAQLMAPEFDRSLAEAEREEQKAAESQSQPADERVPPAAEKLLEFIEGTRSLAETPVAWPLAMLGSFSVLDLIWFPVGFWMAFKAVARSDKA